MPSTQCRSVSNSLLRKRGVRGDLTRAITWGEGNQIPPTPPFSKGGTRARSLERYLFLLLIALVTLTARADEENLIANPGFEDLSGAAPARWDVYVKPMEGASGRLVPEAHGGKYAVQLQITTAYEQDPANNWSQNVIGEFANKKMRLSGFVKVEDAQDAAIWAQCWRKAPWGVVSVASTGTRAPVYGTKDWDEVFVEFDVPAHTDFITVRCVLKGSGTAWFDDLSLTVIGDAPHKAELNPPMASPAPVETSKKSGKSTLGDQVRDQLDSVRLREENKLLRDTIDSLKSSNEDLQKRVKALEEKGGEKVEAK